jgi:hypothetical protein
VGVQRANGGFDGRESGNEIFGHADKHIPSVDSEVHYVGALITAVSSPVGRKSRIIRSCGNVGSGRRSRRTKRVNVEKAISAVWRKWSTSIVLDANLLGGTVDFNTSRMRNENVSRSFIDRVALTLRLVEGTAQPASIRNTNTITQRTIGILLFEPTHLA